VLILFLVINVALLLCPSCKCQNEVPKLNISFDVNIDGINLANHTLTADVSIEIESFPENASDLQVKLNDISSDLINFSKAEGVVNGTQDFQGDLKGTYWYLNGQGQLYPFDFNIAVFQLIPNHVEYQINNSSYGSQYTFNIVEQQVHFSGLSKGELESIWTISPSINGDKLNVKLDRNDPSAQLLIFSPLFWLLIVVASLPVLSSDRKTKLQFYSSIMVFAPIFLFAIQGFIPPRNLNC
jgi:hypothetical protein